MARRNILAGVTGNTPAVINSVSSAAAPAATLTAFATRGAVGSISRSIGDLTAKVSAAKDLEAKLTAGQTVIELDANLVDPSFVADRMTVANDEAFNALKSAIASEGQGSPILVRPHPTAEGRYQVAFGHRRLRVAKDLGKPVRAVVKSLSDQELVLAQGQENSVRADLSFIERARFAQSLVELNYGRDVIMAALAIDKTTASRMLSVVTRLPSVVIDAIGPAPATGRDRWVELAGYFETNSPARGLKELLRSEGFRTSSSDDRFNRVLALITKTAGIAERGQREQGDRQDMQRWAPSEGPTLVTLKRSGRSCVITIDQRQAPDFGEFLLRQMDRLYSDYLKGQRDG